MFYENRMYPPLLQSCSLVRDNIQLALGSKSLVGKIRMRHDFNFPTDAVRIHDFPTVNNFSDMVFLLHHLMNVHASMTG